MSFRQPRRAAPATRTSWRNALRVVTNVYSIVRRIFTRSSLSEDSQNLTDLNRLSEELGEKIKEHTFGRMRALFLKQITRGTRQQILAKLLQSSQPFRPLQGEPKDSAIEALSDAKLIPLLKALKATTVHTLRNRVVHKRAYRPTRNQVQAALEEARSILFPLTSRLGLHDDVNW